jgi:hypothetical protein
MARRGNTLRTTVVTWQGAVVICTLLYLGCIVAISVDLSNDAQKPMSTRDMRGLGQWQTICWVTVPATLAALLMALWSRFSKIRLRAERRAVLGKLVTGLSISAAAVITTIVLYRSGSWEMFGSRWYFLPTGLYLAGMAVLANAMNPSAS